MAGKDEKTQPALRQQYAEFQRGQAIQWIRANVFGPAAERARQMLSGKGGNFSIPAPFVALKKTSNPADAMMVLGLLEMHQRVGALASLAAHSAGAERAVAERTGEIMSTLYAQSATRLLAAHGVEPAASDPDAMTWPHSDTFDQVDWGEINAPTQILR